MLVNNNNSDINNYKKQAHDLQKQKSWKELADMVNLK